MLASDQDTGERVGPDTYGDVVPDRPEELVDDVERALAALREDPEEGEAIQLLVRSGVLMLARRMLEGKAPATFPDSRTPNTTAIALAICALMEAGDIDVPQLATWQALGLGAVPTDPDRRD